MHFLYSLCFTLGFLLALPYFLFQALFHQKYLASFRQRLGFLPKRVAFVPAGGIWIHAVSVGEVLAILPLTEALRRTWPNRPLFVSTTTLTGQKLAQSRLSGKASIFYFPLDWKFAVQKSLATIRPAVVLIAETEIWPNFLRACRGRGIPVLLINGRLSDRSVRRYSAVPSFVKRVLDDFQHCCVQTQLDRDRLLSLGASPNKVEVCGNLKYEIGVPEGIQARTETYLRLLGLNQNSFVVVAGSTMKDEEPHVLSAFRFLRDQAPQAVLILAPRHPERFKEVESILVEQSFHFCKRSELDANRPAKSDPGIEVILLDSMGELATIYTLADLVFIGGSLVPTGGHNILEPALYRKPIFFGPYMMNFREMAEHFLEKQAAIKVGNAAELGRSFVEFSRNPKLGEGLGERAYAILLANRGGMQKVLSRIEPMLSGSPPRR